MKLLSYIQGREEVDYVLINLTSGLANWALDLLAATQRQQQHPDKRPFMWLVFGGQDATFFRAGEDPLFHTYLERVKKEEPVIFPEDVTPETDPEWAERRVDDRKHAVLTLEGIAWACQIQSNVSRLTVATPVIPFALIEQAAGIKMAPV